MVTRPSAAAVWTTPHTVVARHADEDLLVGGWQCGGRVRDWDVELAPHTELVLQESGVHGLRRGRARAVVDGGTACVLTEGEEYLRSSPSPLPQRSTHVLLRGELAEALESARLRPVVWTSSRVALAHARLRRAEGPVAVHERALDVVEALLARAEPSRPPAPPPRHGWVALAETAQHALATRFRETLRLGALARTCGVSPFHLSRVFRAVTGDTVHRALVRLRLRAALVSLDDGVSDLGALGLELGFASHAHFSDAFRREYGIAPSRLRGGR